MKLERTHKHFEYQLDRRDNMANNLTSIQQIVYDRIIGTLRRRLPNLNTNDNTLFSDLFIRPMVELMAEEYELLNSIVLQQSLKDASNMTDQQMDTLGARYFLTRRSGSQATGVVVLELSDLPIRNTGNEVFTVNAGITTTSSNGLTFISTETINITRGNSINYYNTSTKRFEIPIRFRSVNAGVSYNIDSNLITSINIPVVNLLSVSNPNPFTGGTDNEANAQFATRIRNHYAAPNLGTVRGYQRFIEENFPLVKQVLVVGFGDPLMLRDRINTAHWGSKVDLYIKGEALATHTLTNQSVTQSGSVYSLEIDGSKGNPMPLVDIVSVYNASGTISPSSYKLQKYNRLSDNDNPDGTNKEKVKIFFTDGVSNGSTVNVVYRYNALITAINDRMITGDERPPTADILVVEASKKYVSGSVTIKTTTAIGLMARGKAELRQQFASYIDSVPMDEEIQYSDMLSTLSPPVARNSMTHSTFQQTIFSVDFLQQPSSFMLLDQNNLMIFDCFSEKKQSFLKDISQVNEELLEYYARTITKYSFYNLLHAFIHAPGSSNILGITDNSYVNKKIDFNNARKVMQLSKVLIDLSPATSKSERNEQFVSDYFAVFEYKEYTSDEWKEIIDVADSLKNNKTLERLALYLLCIVYVATQDITKIDADDELINYLKEVQVSSIIT